MAHTSFNWHRLTRTQLFESLWDLKKSTVSKPITGSKLHRILRRAIEKELPVQVCACYIRELEDIHVTVEANYYGNLDQMLQAGYVQLKLCYSSRDQEFVLTPARYRKFCLEYADTVLHELIHIRQFRKRNFKLISEYRSVSTILWLQQEQNYLGHRDEIEAYAFNIACELLDAFKNDSAKVKQYITNPGSDLRTRRKDPTWQRYLQAFDYDYQHPIIKKLRKATINYLPRALAGKPFKTKKFIDK